MLIVVSIVLLWLTGVANSQSSWTDLLQELIMTFDDHQKQTSLFAFLFSGEIQEEFESRQRDLELVQDLHNMILHSLPPPGHKNNLDDINTVVEAYPDQVVFCGCEYWLMEPEALDTTLCTHLFYNFAGMDDSFQVVPPNPSFFIEKDGWRRIHESKAKNPSLKVLIGLGGYNQGSILFSNMAADPSYRQTFITSALSFVRRYNFDGLHFHWHAPTLRGGRSEDRENFSLLVKEMGEAFRQRELLFTVGLVATNAEQVYNIRDIHSHADFFHLYSFDYYGRWDAKLGLASPLFPLEEDGHSASTSVEYYLKAGMPGEKLLMGIQIYCRTFLPLGGSRPLDKASPQSYLSPFSMDEGFAFYYEVCTERNSSGWRIEWVPEQRGAYWTNSEKWVTCEQPASIAYKMRFLQEMGLAGAWLYAVDHDDHMGACGETFPLLKAVNNYLKVFKQYRPTGTL